MRFFLPAFLFLLCTCGPAIFSTNGAGGLRAQQLLPQDFTSRASMMRAELDSLVEVGFRVRKQGPNPYLDDHLTLYSKAEKLEIRFHLRPAREGDRMADLPNLRAHTTAMNLGSNDEDAVTTVHSFDEEELSALNADWMRMYTFRPKTSYSSRVHAQLVAIYRKDRGTAYIILLFDDVPPTIEDRQLALSFSSQSPDNDDDQP